jgi:hypothetical protein
MHKITSTIILLSCLSVATYSQSYQQELNKLNSYLIKSSELNGNDSLWVNKYGELYIRDGYLKSCYAYCKIKHIENATISSSKKELRVNCKYGKRFIKSSGCRGEYTSIKHKYGSTDSVGALFKNFIDAYYGNYPNYNTIITNVLSPKEALKKVNTLLVSINDGNYVEMKLIDLYLYLYYKDGKYVGVPVDKLDNIYLVDGYGIGAKFLKWHVDCEKCFKSNQSINIPKGEDFYFSFFIPKNQLQEGEKLKILFDDLAVALDVKNNSVSNYNVKTYQPKSVKDNEIKTKQSLTNNGEPISSLLLKINNYLKDNITKLKSVEIKDNKVFFNFRLGVRTEGQSISKKDFTTQVTIKDVEVFSLSEVRIVSNGQTEIFLSSLTNAYSKYITVSNDSKKQQLEIKKLLIELQKLLKSTQ